LGGLAAVPLVSLVGGHGCRTLIPAIHRRGCFALFDLVGKQLSPRIRDLGGITLYRTGQRADFTARYPRAGPPLTRRLNTELITTHWDDLLRIAASVKYGHATAALVVGKLCSSKRQQNALSAAIKEYGALTAHDPRRPVSDETYRRKIARQLNKGENLHALRRDLFYASKPSRHGA
jgi:TnpA family transposase